MAMVSNRGDDEESSFRNKATHFVSDLTTVLFNPISDHTPNSTEDMAELDRSNPESVSEDELEDKMLGPDTSSFKAFLYSFLSSSNDLASEEECSESSRGRKCDGSDHCGLEMKILQPPVENLLNVRLPDVSEPSLLLSEKARWSLYTSLPAVAQGRKWVLLYSTWRHGISLSTLYRRSMLSPGYSLLVVGDRKGSIFGGLVEAPLTPTSKRKYQGTHNTFVFTNTSGSPVVFRPTGVNRYFTLCSTNFLALGGGGHFALYLDGDLLSGSSSISETYGNPCLAHSEDFEVKEVELWSFNTPRYAETISTWRTEAPEICR